MRYFLTAALLASALAAPAAAQRAPSPDERIERLERQTRQIQRRVFPQGQPADTAGFYNDPAASQTVVVALSNRIDNLERQLTEMTRRAEENGTRAATLEAEVARLRNDIDTRIRPLEAASQSASRRVADVGSTTQRVTTTAPAEPRPSADPSSSDFTAEGEAAYDAGFQLWQGKKYDQAVTALRAMASSFPGHRRVSWANNLAGRALLDSGQPRAAAEALLANYRGNPKGERAPDSLFYLGQALVELKQPAQACKAYAELEDVYGSTMRADLRSQLPGAKSRASC